MNFSIQGGQAIESQATFESQATSVNKVAT